MQYTLAIDQGTTSTRCIIFDANLHIVGTAQQEFPQHFPNSGWVEHNPNDLWDTTVQTCQTALDTCNISAQDVGAVGITNQRETTILWDKNTGKPIYNAIVWQDRRTATYCEHLKRQGYQDIFCDKTGLLIDSYFSATKIRWILQHTKKQKDAEKGNILFGTVDCYLIWRLTKGTSHVTDATNASRTMLYNIRENKWDSDICAVLDIPLCMLPTVKDCADDFGSIHPHILGTEIPICGVAGDQQAATIGQACFEPGMVKSTYGTGGFMLLNTGDTLIKSSNGLLSTIAYRLNGKTVYALEGSIFIAGSVVQWLRDGLHLISTASDSGDLAKTADASQNIYMVPAFTGLGAPYWDMECRGAVFGLTRNTGPAEFAKSALQSVGYQTRDLVECMQADWQQGSLSRLRVDGGMSASDWTMQFLSDIIGQPVDRPIILETTALGVAWLAGSYAGIYPNAKQFSKLWQLEYTFTPKMHDDERTKLYKGWQQAVQKVLS